MGGRVLFASALLGSVLVTAGTPGVAPAAGLRPGGVNVNDRAAVIASYEAEFNRVEPATGWNGDVGACKGGTTTAAFQQSVLQRINWFRAMAGIGDVTYNSSLNSRQQAGALISSAEGKLNHTPASSAKCWTKTGYDATSGSNLSLGSSGVNAISSYVSDQGDNNTAVGHRWWVLLPDLKPVTSGDIPAGSSRDATNALSVSGTSVAPAQSPRDGFVAWPPPGFVPDDIVYPRWSLAVYTYGSASRSDFTNATVSVTGPNGPLSVRYDHRAQGRIVFVPGGFDNAPVQVSTDVTYTVSVSGITGGPASSYTYSVTVVPANSAPYDDGSFTYGADKCAKKGDNIGGPSVFDPEGEAVTVTLVSGEGDSDNALFGVKKVAGADTVYAAADLDRTRRDYSVRYRMTDAKGAYVEKAYSFTLADSNSASCPKSTTASSGSGGTTGGGAATTTRRSVSGTISRGKSRLLSSFVARPAGTVTYSVTGGCRLNGTKKIVYARKTKGTCTVTMTGRTSTKVSIVTLRLNVR